MDEALASLHSQGMGDDLEIIVQDGDVEPDAGMSDALNKGFAKAHGEWLFWLNADDVLLPGALGKVKERIQSSPSSPALTWIAGNEVMIDGPGRVIRCVRDRGKRSAYEGRPVRVYGPSSFFRRELLDEAGGFDTTLRYAMDSDLWMKFRERGHWFAKVDDYLFAFRVHAGSLTASRSKPAGEQERQDREVDALRVRHGVGMSASDAWLSKLRRLIDGSYLRGGFDTIRFRGRKLSDLELR